MRACRFLLVPLTWTIFVLPLSAGLFSKHPKPDPAVRVPELLGIVKNDQDEHKRSSAAEELRQYDTAAFPDIVPTLIDVLLHDAKPGVRAQAAETLGKLRPVSPQVGIALEQAQTQDAAMRVRLQARYTLLHYHWSGYHTPTVKKGDGPSLGTNETSLAPVAAVPSSASPSTPRLTPVPTGKPIAETPRIPFTPIPRPFVTLKPKTPPVDNPGAKVPARPDDQGPELNPPM